MFRDILGREIKIGQTVVVPTSSPAELHIAKVVKLAKKKVRVEQALPIFANAEEEEKWENEVGFTIDGTWFPEAIYIIEDT